MYILNVSASYELSSFNTWLKKFRWKTMIGVNVVSLANRMLRLRFICRKFWCSPYVCVYGSWDFWYMCIKVEVFIFWNGFIFSGEGKVSLKGSVYVCVCWWEMVFQKLDRTSIRTYTHASWYYTAVGFQRAKRDIKAKCPKRHQRMRRSDIFREFDV